MIELLLSLILTLTGIARDVDPTLTAIAEQRAAATSTDATFSHDGMDPCCAEILAWNYQDASNAANRAAQQWRNSAPHWAILTDRTLTRIGCGVAIGENGRYNFACVLDAGSAAPALAPAPAPTTRLNRVGPKPAVVTLPDTAMRQP